MKQDPDVPVGNRHHLPAACDAAGSGIDQKVIEGVRGHGSIIRRYSLGFGPWAWAWRRALSCVGSAWSSIAGLLWLLCAAPLSAADKTTVGELITEPPTLISLGFEWRIDGDDNRNAQVTVSYRKAGEQAWKAGPPLLRHRQRAHQRERAAVHDAERIRRQPLRPRAGHEL